METIIPLAVRPIHRQYFINPQPSPPRSHARRFSNHQLSPQPQNRHVPSMSRPPTHHTSQRRAPPSTNQNYICWYQNYGPGARK